MSVSDEKYRLKLLNISLLVPVAQLSASVFQEINTIITRKNEPKSVGIHYRRIEVRPISLPRNKEEYNSDGLFTDCDLPCKIVICFVKTASKVGDYHANPFDLVNICFLKLYYEPLGIINFYRANLTF